MAAFVQYRREEVNSGEAREKEKENLKLVQNSDQFEETSESESGKPLISIMHGPDDLLNSENKTTDYDWLLSPPRKVSLEMEQEKKPANPASKLESPPAPKRRQGGAIRPSRKATPTTKPSAATVAPSKRCSSVTKSAPPNVKKSMPERPVSAPRVRPSRGRGCLTDVNPVLMGTKMVERVVNMRKLAPPLSASQENSGFGRTLSNKSFDMALRHLDIRRSMITKVPASGTSSSNTSSSDR